MKRQLQSLGMLAKQAPTRTRRSGPMKGGKAKPKYRGPNGETWAGRGMQPTWLTQLVARGRNREEFVVKGASAPAKAKPKKRDRTRKKAA
jgi:DNA-binding protein H-NS